MPLTHFHKNPFYIVAAVALLVAFCGLLRADDSKAPLPPTAMSDDELAHLVHFVKLTNQDLNDWSGWEAHDQENMESYRYQIAFMAYALSLQQYLSVPAWREVHKATADRLMERMLQKPVWEFWAEVSKTRKDYDPDWEGPQPSKHDPVGEKNIMYSGHIVHMGALYEMLYRDHKWSQPGAITFHWDENEKYEYDLQKLMGVIHKEMLSPREKETGCVAGVECEPNLIFPECNQHPLLAFQLNDHVHRTKMYDPAREKLAHFFDCSIMYDPVTKSVANAWRIKQGKLIRVPGMPSASADGWTGAFMVSWNPDLVRGAYENQKANNIRRNADGTLRIAFDPLFELGLGFFALLAVELGDMETARELFAHADTFCEPVRENGALHYPYRMKVAVNKMSSTHDRVIGMARSNRPGGLTAIHEQPWGDEAFAHPLVEGIDFPRVLVSEARWLSDNETLVVEVLPGHDAPAETSFRIAGVKAGEKWSLTHDGKQIGALGADRVASGAIATSDDKDSLTLKLPLAERTRLELKKVN